MTESLPRRPFRFSSPATGCRTRQELVERARLLEDLGFSTITTSDHFGEQLGPIASLMAIADATSTLRISSMVFSSDYRHPAVLAKEAATLDLLSDGRLDFGIGAGWKESDYNSTGIPFEPAGRRIDRMEEALTVIKALWAEGAVTHHGEFFDIEGLDGFPKPIQRPHPPITVGGGSKRILQFAAREADVVSFIPSMKAGRVDATTGRGATPEATDRRLEWIHEAAGGRLDQIELQVRLEAAILIDDPEPIFEGMAGGFGLTPDEARGTPYALVGPTEAMVEALEVRRERWGFSYVGIPFDAAVALAPVVSKLAGQ